MKRRLRGIGDALLLCSLILVVGCTSGSGLVGVQNSLQGSVNAPNAGRGSGGGPPPLPATDAGLVEHVPQQLIIRFLPGASTETVLKEINGTVVGQLKTFNAAVVGLPQGASIVDAIRKVQAMSGVKYAEPNYVYRALIIPNDPFFATKQWGPQQIQAPAAWDTTQGSSTSVMAIIDTGVSTTSSEFTGVGKLLAGINTLTLPPCTAPFGVTNDDHGHGTHVAGIAAAPGNDGNGIAGMSWLSPILPIKVLDSTGSGTLAQVACGLVFAGSFATANTGDRVVANMSLGGAGYSQLLKDAIDLAIGDNVVVVAAAGNSGSAAALFPAAFSGVMAVGATDPTNARAPFSTYGPQLSVVAPGVDIYSTLPTSGALSSPAGFGFESGTSMAAPHVAGVAALVRAKNPTFSVSQVRSQIEQTATRLPSGGTGFNPQFGWGLVNAAAAVGAPVASNYGTEQVTVAFSTATGLPVPGADVILWVGAPSCSGLTQEVQTAQTSAGAPGVGTAGVAVFNAVPAGSYCVTTVLASPPGKGATLAPFAVTAGATTSTTVPITPFPPDSTGLYVANQYGPFGITVFPPSGNGNVFPTRTLGAGQSTGAALDSAGNLYVTHSITNPGSITVYPPGASGNWPPERTISGTSTGLNTPTGVALDSAGNLYVANQIGTSITVYAPGADGNVAPIRTISGTSTGLSTPIGIALDSAGDLYVANFTSITVYAPGANGNVAPIRTISGASTGLFFPEGVALDGAGTLYVANLNANSITVYAPGANGNVAPIRTISGASTGLVLPQGVALDSAGNLYVSNSGFSTITVYPPGANGNVAPIRTISGPGTGLNTPFLMFVR